MEILTAHQLRVNDIFRIPANTATELMQKNQNANSITKIPPMVPMTLTMSPSGTSLDVNAFVFRMFGACVPKDTKPAAV